MWLGFLAEAEAPAGWNEWLVELQREKRVARLLAPSRNLWIAAERLPQFEAIWPSARLEPAIVAPAGHARRWSREEAWSSLCVAASKGRDP